MLNRLRYLNLKGNKLKMLPQCVCLGAEYEWVNRSQIILPAQLMKMPSLEILDVSRNEIVALPEEPGRLVQLRVRSSDRPLFHDCSLRASTGTFDIAKPIGPVTRIPSPLCGVASPESR